MSSPVTPNLKERMDLLMDFVHDYKGFGIHESQCRVRVFANVMALGPLINAAKEISDAGDEVGNIAGLEPTSHIVVIISEMGVGTSVTNAADTIATEVLPKLVPFPELRKYITWVEHYPADQRSAAFRPGIPAADVGETFDLLTFAAYDENGPYFARNRWKSGFSGAKWRHSTRAEVEALIGREVEL